MIRVYVAGPIHGSGTQANNIHNATEAAVLLVNAGCAPFVPHYWFPLEIRYGNVEQQRFKDLDFAWIAQCHAVVRISGVSPGADAEEAYASSCGIPVFKQREPDGGILGGVHELIREIETGRFDRHTLEAPVRLDFERLQAEVTEWVSRQPFGKNQQAWEPLIGVAEEVGELSHSHLKEHQKIRGTAEEHQTAAKDAIGDILVYLASYCKLRGFSMQQCIETTWREVKARDWAKNAKDGCVVLARRQ